MKTIDINGMTNFDKVRGETNEWYWVMDYTDGDLYEAEELFRKEHQIRSNRLYLVHYPDGKVYEPVPPVDGQYLGNPVVCDKNGTVALLVINFIERVISIRQFLYKEEKVQEVARLPLSAVKDCYNLMIHISPLSLTRQANDGIFEIVWPEQISFEINERESLNFRDGDKFYFNIWYEDPDYREETLVRSLPEGKMIDRLSGDVFIMPNGERWLVK